jgi:predicted aminopeptidase
VEAYSTLGWFSDPVLNTFIHRDETDLADLIFHELAHQKLFVKGDTDFNEAFATCVAREGVRRWLTRQGHADRLQAWEERMRRTDEFLGLVFEARRALELVYQGAPAFELSGCGGEGSACDMETRMTERKARVFDQLRADYETLKGKWGGANDFDGWFVAPVNNARLNAEATYYELLPGFALLLSRTGHDLERFYAEVGKLAKLPKAERSIRVRNQNH